MQTKVIVSLSIDPETLAQIDRMAEEESGGNRSLFMRSLVEQRERLRELLAPSKRQPQEMKLAAR